MDKQSVNELASIDAAYIAGLIDGEGTITLTREHARESKRLVVSISNTEIALLQFVMDRVGAGKITNKRVYSEKLTPSYTYKITNRQALTLLEEIAQYLRSYKRDRAGLALNTYISVTPRNGRYTPEQKNDRKRFEKEFLAITPR